MGARPISGSRLSAPRLPRMPRMPAWQVLRRRLIVLALVAAALAAGFQFWFRDSSFVRVERVEVTGLEGNGGAEAALSSTAAEMSTLDVDEGALRAAVADQPDVASLSATADFPHALTIDVVVRRPAAYADADGGTILAGDGVVLATGVDRPDGIPPIVAEAPGAAGDRANGPALVLALILGAVPREVSAQVESARVDPENGPIVTLSGGLELRFGNTSQADLKWRAASAVLADPGLTSATYIDLSVPSRPVAG